MFAKSLSCHAQYSYYSEIKKRLIFFTSVWYFHIMKNSIPSLSDGIVINAPPIFDVKQRRISI